MSKKLQINTRVRRLFHYLDDFQKGVIRVPAFQREFVWSLKDKIDLFESIKNGYPIGSVLFWRPGSEEDGSFFEFETEKIGAYYIPKISNEHYYILDGYQRISTLFGCLVNPNSSELERDYVEWHKEYDIVYNLKDNKFEHNKSIQRSFDVHKIPLYKFVDSKEFFEFQKELFRSNLNENDVKLYLERYENLSSRLVDYQLPSIDIVGGTAVEAVDIFSRVNSTGVKISDDWKVSALSFNPARNFRLGTEIDNLLKELNEYNFQSLKRSLVLQCIVNSFGKVFFDQSNSKILEELALREDFIDRTRETLKSIRKAVEFLHDELCVVNVKLLPYNNQLIFITDFFNKKKIPDKTSIEDLKRWFWFTSYSGYFTVYNLSKQRLAYNKFQSFIEAGYNPVYLDRPNKKFIVGKIPPKITMGSVRAKSLVIMMLNILKDHFRMDKINSNLKILPLFLTGEREIDMLPENQVVAFDISNGPVIGRQKNLTSWLDSSQDLSVFFLPDELKKAYQDGQQPEEILELRKNFILRKERKFVEELGLEYEEDFS